MVTLVLVMLEAPGTRDFNKRSQLSLAVLPWLTQVHMGISTRRNLSGRFAV